MILVWDLIKCVLNQSSIQIFSWLHYTSTFFFLIWNIFYDTICSNVHECMWTIIECDGEKNLIFPSTNKLPVKDNRNYIIIVNNYVFILFDFSF